MVSSRDRSPVSVEIVWLGLSPGRRRLRFSFQINDVKDPTGFRQTHCLAPVVGGGGYLVTGLFRVNRPFQAFCDSPGFPRKPRNLAAKIAAGRRGASLKVRRDSIEAREHTRQREKGKSEFRPHQSLSSEPRPEREAAI